jgi:hypothetical protein
MEWCWITYLSKIAVLWDVTQCRLVGIRQRFEGMCWHSVHSSNLKEEVACFSETLAPIYRTIIIIIIIIIIIMYLFILTASGFLPYDSGTAIRHNTQVTHTALKTQHTKLY